MDGRTDHEDEIESESRSPQRVPAQNHTPRGHQRSDFFLHRHTNPKRSTQASTCPSSQAANGKEVYVEIVESTKSVIQNCAGLREDSKIASTNCYADLVRGTKGAEQAGKCPPPCLRVWRLLKPD